MNKRNIYPYWTYPGPGATKARQKLPKQFRAKGSLQTRMRNGLKFNKENKKWETR